jgi:hypothetical protein
VYRLVVEGRVPAVRVSSGAIRVAAGDEWIGTAQGDRRRRAHARKPT